MRKIICSVLVFLFAFCTVTTAESVIDISTMTIDELISLRDSIDEQIRGIWGSDNYKHSPKFRFSIPILLDK